MSEIWKSGPGFNGDLMGFNGIYSDFMEFYSDSMGYENGIYPLMNIQKAIENGHL